MVQQIHPKKLIFEDSSEEIFEDFETLIESIPSLKFRVNRRKIEQNV